MMIIEKQIEKAVINVARKTDRNAAIKTVRNTAINKYRISEKQRSKFITY